MHGSGLDGRISAQSPKGGGGESEYVIACVVPLKLL